MTITFVGHVDSLKNTGWGAEPAVEITFNVEAKASMKPIVLTVPAIHAQAYLPGTPVQFTIFPLKASP